MRVDRESWRFVHSSAGDVSAAIAKAARALGDFRIDGVPTNIGFLRALLAHEDVLAGTTHTRFVEVDNAVADEEAAVAAAKRYLSYFRRTGSASTTFDRLSRRSPTPDRCWSSGPDSARGSSPR